jgi:hypothetical protein
MKKQIRVWSSLGLAALAGSQVARADEIAPGPAAAPAYMQLADNAGEGGEGGEGEGGGASSEMDDAAYLTQLALMQGHLRVGAELYAAGAADMAATHMKHPSDELYSGLKEPFEKRGVKGFDAELEALAKAVEGKAPAEEVATARAAVDAAILKAMAAAKSDAATTLKTVVSLLREAGEEFEIGVKEGKIVNLHEYQDAYGFTMIARDMTEAAKAQAKPEQAAVFDTVLGEIDKLKGVWPDIRGEKPVTAEAKTILVAASKAELASYDLK